MGHSVLRQQRDDAGRYKKVQRLTTEALQLTVSFVACSMVHAAPASEDSTYIAVPFRGAVCRHRQIPLADVQNKGLADFGWRQTCCVVSLQDRSCIYHYFWNRWLISPPDTFIKLPIAANRHRLMLMPT